MGSFVLPGSACLPLVCVLLAASACSGTKPSRSAPVARPAASARAPERAAPPSAPTGAVEATAPSTAATGGEGEEVTRRSALPSAPAVARPAVERAAGIGQGVVNGSAWLRGGIALPAGLTTVVIPKGAVVFAGAKPGRLEVLVHMRVGFAGHPPQPVTIDAAQRNMGCAHRRDGAKLTLSTFGEWDSHIEGAASIDLGVQVPDGLRVEAKSDLAGEAAEAGSWPSDAKGGGTGRVGYWYAVVNAAPGWTRLPLALDTTGVARRALEIPGH